MRFHAGRGTVDVIIAACQLQGKCMEQHRNLYTTFVDLPKAFDSQRRRIVEYLEQVWLPHKFIAIVRQFREGMQAQVLDDGELSTPFAVSNGASKAVSLPRQC